MLKGYMNQYIESFKAMLGAMFDVRAEALSTTNFNASNKNYKPLNNFTAQIPFYGKITGDFFLSIDEDQWKSLMSSKLQDSSEELCDASLKEFLNTVTGDAISIISEDFINLTYLTPRIIKGSIDYPAVERVNALLHSEDLGRIELVICLDQMKLEINQELEDILSKMKDKDKQLIHSDRLSTLGTMAASIMHEINNPTSFISGNVQILRDYYVPRIVKFIDESEVEENSKLTFIRDEMPKICDSMMNGISRINKLTQKLKSFSRSSGSDMIYINLNQCVTQAIHFTKETINPKVEVSFIPDKDMKTAYADEQQIEQVLINLLVNASHAIETLFSPKITIKTTTDECFAYCKIKDNGGGISPQNLKKIWDPFFTTKGKEKGTGLGLAICKDIIETHDGSIEYTGDDNGAEFTIRLPLKDI
ncbi:MAG: ATP-binding protein [Lentisphaeraceae bacterium]|nr:ATP-binding protein [Lentisphaeraceae bacterium]